MICFTILAGWLELGPKLLLEEREEPAEAEAWAFMAVCLLQ